MVIALLVFLFLGLVVATVPGLLVGFVFVVTTKRLSRKVRIPSLVVVAAVVAALWLSLGGVADLWLVTAMGLTFMATLVSGATFLGIEAARKRRVLRYPAPAPAWQGW
ncbi:hypothetical protein [Streptomyces sp. NPDC091371]|uniref:hypothetical protein n=1 Tax=Streptomyces sp. NPDC091371 TaxID=3155303 RepID=UPI0034484689